MKKNIWIWGIFILILAACTPKAGKQSVSGLSQYVNPFVGVDYVGHTHPCAQLPFGMVQAGPDTGTDKWEH